MRPSASQGCARGCWPPTILSSPLPSYLSRSGSQCQSESPPGPNGKPNERAMPQPCSWLRTLLFHAHGAPGVFVSARLVAVGRIKQGVFVGRARVRVAAGVALGVGSGVLTGHPGDPAHRKPILTTPVNGYHQGRQAPRGPQRGRRSRKEGMRRHAAPFPTRTPASCGFWLRRVAGSKCNRIPIIHTVPHIARSCQKPRTRSRL